MTKLTIGLLPVTNRICVGRLNKAGTIWLSGRQDITDEAVMTVVAYIKKDRVVYERDGKTYELKEVGVVEEIVERKKDD